jgi:hypothetical protein
MTQLRSTFLPHYTRKDANTQVLTLSTWGWHHKHNLLFAKLSRNFFCKWEIATGPIENESNAEGKF